MYAHIERPKENKSRAVTNSAPHKKSKVKEGFVFMDNRPAAISRRKPKEMVNKPIQMVKGDKKLKKKGEDTLTVWKPDNSQENIQNFIIALWLKSPKDDLDLKRAQYMSNYSKDEGGWCDGWSYVLSQNGDELAEIWKEIDNACTNESEISSTTKYQAIKMARSAALYHITNGDLPTNPQKLADYQDANYDIESKPGIRESWRHDYKAPLELYVVMEEIKELEIGHTLRLTSPTHDAAVNRTRNGYLVSETENYGVQLCTNSNEVLKILKNWQEECKKNGDQFFSQTMVV